MYKSHGAACISPGGGESENYTFNKGILRGKRQGGTTPRLDTGWLINTQKIKAFYI